MATYEVLAQQFTTSFAEDSKLITYNKKSILPTHKIKSILKSVRKFFKKPKVAPVHYNVETSVSEILPNEQQQPIVEINFFSEEESDNLENERLEAQMANQ